MKNNELYTEWMEDDSKFFETDSSQIKKFSNYLSKAICAPQHMRHKKGIVFVCIGTDRMTGDSLGPLLGYKLKHIENEYIKVIGTLKEPIHAQNMSEYLTMIEENFKDWLVIAIDASIGRSDHIGMASVSTTPLFPGKGVGKELEAVGDVSITGIISSSGSSQNIMCVRLAVIMDLVDFIYAGIVETLVKDFSYSIS